MALNSEEELLYKRFIELAQKSSEHGYYVFTDFLGLSEQSVFTEAKNSYPRGTRYTMFGGTDGCERVMVRFGDPEELGYEEPFPISVIKAEPKASKFADKLSHRDFLGSLMNLGIERSCLGDIVIIDNVGYIFAKEEMTDYICESLTRIKHTDINAKTIPELPKGEFFKTETVKIQLSGERIDAAVAKAFGLSRDDAQSLFKKKLVFVCGKICENNSYAPKINDIVSVRGYGRFIYCGSIGLTKKGKLNVELKKYV